VPAVEGVVRAERGARRARPPRAAEAGTDREVRLDRDVDDPRGAVVLGQPERRKHVLDRADRPRLAVDGARAGGLAGGDGLIGLAGLTACTRFVRRRHPDRHSVGERHSGAARAGGHRALGRVRAEEGGDVTGNERGCPLPTHDASEEWPSINGCYPRRRGGVHVERTDDPPPPAGDADTAGLNTGRPNSRGMRDQFRPLLAALLAMALPGLGHVVLRRWGRALLWHLTIVGGGVALFALYDDVPVGSTISPVEAAETAHTPDGRDTPRSPSCTPSPRSTRTSSGGQMSPSGDAPMRPPRAIRRRAASDDGDEIDDPAGANSPYPTVAATGRSPRNADRPAEVECPLR